MMFRFEKISLKQIMTFSEILAESSLKKREHIKEKYLKLASNFDETEEFLTKVGLIVKKRKTISPQPLFQTFLKKEKEPKKNLVNIFIEEKNLFKDYLFEFFSLFKLENQKYEFKPSTAQRLQYSGLRNFLIDLGFLFYDSTHKKYIISSDYFHTFSEMMKCHQLSLENFLKNIKKQDKISKIAELEIIKYEKKRLSKFPDLEKYIEHISEKNVLAGYDIKSYTANVRSKNHIPRYIEVKAVSRRDYKFFWTRNEINCAKLYGKNYYLYLVPVLSLNKLDLNNLVIIKNPYVNVYKKEDKWLRKVELIEFFQKTSTKSKNGS